jgi:hypothetical protein
VAERKTRETDDIETVRLAAEADLEVFIRLVAPKQVFGAIHSELIRWMTRQDAKSHQLVLLPRDHQKSRLAAYKAAWLLTRDPAIRILYISSTANLAEKQLKFIKDIITSPIYRKYWPEMVHPDEGKRERWTSSEISVDHPKRREEGVRDPTIFTGGLTTNLVGMHCDGAILDDVVVDDTAYSVEGREKLKTQYSLLASIEGTASWELVVGTRYHPKDLYADQIEMAEEVYDEDGVLAGYEEVYEVFERVLEDSPNGDGTGTYLWPRQQRKDGKWFGFDQKERARKKAKYLDPSKFRSQYYNDPNDVSDSPIKREWFQYYDKKHLSRSSGRWYFRGSKLNVYASIDFAFSRAKKADHTALVVVGIDSNSNIYVLDIARIKTDQIADYYKLILEKHIYWDFRKLRAEVNTAQRTIVNELKYNYFMPNGISLAIEDNKPIGNEGSKEERIAAVLEHRYRNMTMWHFMGGECQTLEEELVLRKPPHDDVKDALASAVEICQPPVHQTLARNPAEGNIYHPRFGGVKL